MHTSLDAARARRRAIPLLVTALLLAGGAVAASIALTAPASAAGSADLSITQKFSGSATSGRTVDTVTLHNAGPDTATNINYSKFLATASGTVTVTSNVGVCEFMPPPATTWKLFDACQVGSLAAGGNIVVTVTWGGTAGQAFTSTVTVGSNVVDPTMSNNISTASSWFGPRADLSLSQSAVTGATSGKGNLTSITTNRGPNNANSLQLVSEIKTSSPGLSIVATSANLPTSCQTIPPASGFNFAVACTTNTLAANASWRITFAYTGAAGATVTVKSSVSAISPPDPNTSNNTRQSVMTLHS